MEPQLIKKLLLAKVFELRKNQFTYDSLDRPQSVQNDYIRTKDGPRLRCRIILTAHGCSVATCTMCPLPDEAVDGAIPVTLDNWLNQIRGALHGCPSISTLTLFHNGNFFADREVPKEWRTAIFDYLRGTYVEELVVECLPQYLTEERLKHARKCLGPIRLNVAIGLQSSSRLVRELCISSTCLEDTFQDAVRRLHAQGDEAQAFLMFHPPFLTIEESMWDLRESIKYVQAARVTPTICPMRIAPNTVVADLASKGLYEAPNLWYLYEVLNGFSGVRVAASLLQDSLPAMLRDAFERLNRWGELPRIEWMGSGKRPVQPSEFAILSRIEHYLKMI